MIILYGIVLAALSLYSYSLLDPNITFFNSSYWTEFRNVMVQLGYYQRPLSTAIYTTFIALLFLLHWRIVKGYKNVSLLKLGVLSLTAGILAYPFASHDIFNYLFDARIFTHYGENPYLRTALDFPQDPMTRFMHWTHRTYPYGPSFLILSFIPSYLSLGKFILGYLLFKILIGACYALAVYVLYKWNKEWAVFFTTHPLVLIDGLINAHNDLIAVSLALAGLYLIAHNKKNRGRFLLLFGGLIKFTTLPIVVASAKLTNPGTRIALLGITLVMAYLTIGRTVQPWYFLTLFALIPYFYSAIKRYSFFFAAAALSYVGFIYTGTWSNVFMYSFLVMSFVINSLCIFFTSSRWRR